jgi:hypothetical protein
MASTAWNRDIFTFYFYHTYLSFVNQNYIKVVAKYLSLHQFVSPCTVDLLTTANMQVVLDRLLFNTWGGVRLSPYGTLATNWPIVPAPGGGGDDDDEYGVAVCMRISGGDCSTQRRPSPVPLFPPQIPLDLIV